jgi:hypothetical protein
MSRKRIPTKPVAWLDELVPKLMKLGLDERKHFVARIGRLQGTDASDYLEYCLSLKPPRTVAQLIADSNAQMKAAKGG